MQAGFVERIDTATYAPHRRVRLAGHPDHGDGRAAAAAQFDAPPTGVPADAVAVTLSTMNG